MAGVKALAMLSVQVMANDLAVTTMGGGVAIWR